MFKQIYRFLSIVIISNFLFSPVAFSKTPVNTNTAKVSKTENNKPAETKNNEELKSDDNRMDYVTKYGVYFDDDVLNSYPQAKPVETPIKDDQKPSDNSDDDVQKPVETPTTNDQKPVINKPADDSMNYVTKYGVYFDKDLLDSYPDKKPVN